MSVRSPLSLVLFRNDLRLDDNPALKAAVESGTPVICAFVQDTASEGDWKRGGASCWWLHHALADLQEQLQQAGGHLLFLSGDALESVSALVRESGAQKVFWNRRYEPALLASDSRLKSGLRALGIAAESFAGNVLHEPQNIQNRSGKPFQVFTPYWKHCKTMAFPKPFSVDPQKRSESLQAGRLLTPLRLPFTTTLEGLGLLPKVDWAGGFRESWTPTRRGALERLDAFLSHTALSYAEDRNRPDYEGTSKLSPWLHFGQITPREILHECQQRGIDTLHDVDKFIAEVGWREFGIHLLYHFPHTPSQNLRSEFDAFPWLEDKGLLRLWQKGLTGYPIVDAGMRQLWATGWMHNRVRMITASFLVKHLLLPWQPGARWFWDTLVDADLGSNTLGWQWTAGCGADAAPYFRIFNPVSQGEKFDPDGHYVRRWVPELSQLPAAHIHSPWEAPTNILRACDVWLGDSYPERLIDLDAGRDRALAAYEKIKKKTADEGKAG